jgi:acyl dehydratase
MSADSAQDTDKIVDDYVAHWNARIGESKRVGVHRTSHRNYAMQNRYVTDDLIRHFVLCHGDTNPLWRNEEYAKASPWGRIIGPPMQIQAISSAVALPPPPAIKGWNLMHAGSTYELERPLVHGDVIDADNVWMGIEERSKAGRPHRTFIITGERRYTDQDGKYVGKYEMKVFGTSPRSGAAPSDAPAAGPQRKRPRYTEEQLSEIYGHYDAEIAGKLRRGADPRYWEDVNEGDVVGEVIKGPVDILDAASYIGSIGGGLGFADKWMLIKDEIDLSPRDPETNAYHFNMDWHLDDGSARAMGQPYAINFGALLENNFGHALTNWCGDHAFVRKIENRILAPMYLGEFARITGGVTRKYEQDGRGLVDIMLTAKQNDGIQVAAHTSTIQLPHRGRPTEVVDEVMGR